MQKDAEIDGLQGVSGSEMKLRLERGLPIYLDGSGYQSYVEFKRMKNKATVELRQIGHLRGISRRHWEIQQVFF